MESESTTTTISTPQDGIPKSRHGRTSGPARRSTRGQWTAEEDEVLRKAVHSFKGKNWKKIAEYFKDRTDVQCLHRWQKVLNPELVKGPWTKEEDEMIVQLIEKYGPKKWSTIARYLPGRIGKQCRERWHNHLNPAINKEAWTQEEELVLIRAHQIYGNKWAELTKFLPGRSDNGIKNHWHSSVKKKLDSYMSSGLLDQYQAMPLAPYERSSTLQSAFMQSNIDGNGEIDSRQNSSMVGCSLSAGDFSNGAINMDHHFYPCRNSQETEQAVYHSDQYFYPELEDISVSISEVSYDMEDCSQFPDHNNVSTAPSQDYQFDFQELSDISLEMRQANMSELPMPYTKESKESTVEPTNSTLSIDVATYTNSANVLTPETECCRVLFPDQESEGHSVSRSLTQEPNEVNQSDSRDPILSASASDSQISEATKSPMQSSSSRLNATAASGKETLRPAPLIITPDKYAKKSSGLICHPFEAEPKCTTNGNGRFICIDDPSSFTCVDGGTNNSSEEDQSYHVNDSKKLVAVSDFASLAEDRPHSPPKHDPNTTSEQHHEDMGASSSLGFPSLDLPVFSCDLLQSKNDPLHDYSPLGIRKLLMSTMTCISPIRLWGSPTGKKTLVGAKSILRKRTRDLLTPLSEKRSDKKLETDIAASLAKDFSRLDVMFDESENRESIFGNNTDVILGDRINSGEGEENWRSNPSSLFSHKMPEETVHIRKSLEKAEQTCMEANVRENDGSGANVENAESFSGVLSELNNCKPVLSSPPGQSVTKAEKAQVLTPRNQFQKTFMANKEQHSSSSLCLVINSPSLARNTEGHLVDNETSNENFSIFCGTPFRRGLESPSAWKSPFYVNSLLPSPRFDTEITIEDMGYIFSPGERSYDSIGVMTQRNEHARAFAAFADAMEVSISPTNDDAEQKKELNKENNDPLLAERRVLDFNDCESPVKATEEVSSYLLKGSR
ncbi:PREDICTED: myb-related protein 3R-1-like [Camelina sativa]|uniref:Myb-related protein 3R-1-like n=1 Tax=Camelina sativa TaxID=90675 RepID=A0ABM1QAI6_CAMSA|nr:PREDICTED: myb-related protein 3R-1-like [Camelina sativa]